jgi:ribosome biogenesis protein SSF1/2
VVLISWNSERGTIDFRHYLITVKAHGVSRRVRKVVESATKGSGAKMLDLGSEKDVADYLLGTRNDEGYETASTSAASEADPEESAVRLAGNYVGRNNKKGEKRAVRLDEIGPRMELRLVKIAEGVPGKEGAVLFHQFSMLPA